MGTGLPVEDEAESAAGAEMELVGSGVVHEEAVHLIFLRTGHGRGRSEGVEVKVVGFHGLAAFEEAAQAEGDVLVQKPEINETPAEFGIEDSRLKALYPVEHDASQGPESAHSVTVELRSADGVERHHVPGGVLVEEALPYEPVGKRETVFVYRHIMAPVEAEPRIRSRRAYEARSGDKVGFRPYSPAGGRLRVPCVIHDAGPEFGTSSAGDHGRMQASLRNA